MTAYSTRIPSRRAALHTNWSTAEVYAPDGVVSVALWLARPFPGQARSYAKLVRQADGWDPACVVRHRVGRNFAVAVGVLLASCRSDRAAHIAALPSAPPAQPAPSAQPSSTVADPPQPARAEPDPPQKFAAWLRERIPAGALIAPAESGAMSIVHTVAPGDTALTIANAYLDITTVYRAKDLAAEIAKRGPLTPGSAVEIPHVVTAPYRTPDEDRLGWPPDRALKGVFITGVYAGAFWPETIEKVAARKLNAIVLDGKDYMGPVNYPTHVKLALEMEAAKNHPIPDFSRAIRFAHARDIRVIVRIPCFHDPWAARHAPRLSLMNQRGTPFEMGWTDPTNVEAQDYVLALVAEVIELGADEVQLDYVRFPVYSQGIKYAAMPPADGHRSQAMKAFVRRVHEVTQAHHVPLSLDLFGVTATGDLSDIEALGQNIGVVGSEAEALSPMVYPSHYDRGFNGFDEPGNHPEIVGMGTRASNDKLKQARNTSTVVRPWLQAMAYKSSAFGPKYIQEEIRSAETSGSTGWLMWDPDNNYWAVWAALPVVADHHEAMATTPP